jgi:hypothetical protein
MYKESVAVAQPPSLTHRLTCYSSPLVIRTVGDEWWSGLPELHGILVTEGKTS